MRELGYQTTSNEMRTRLRSILSDVRCGTFVAKIDDELCAMIGTLTHVTHEHNDPSGKLLRWLFRRSSGAVASAAL